MKKEIKAGWKVHTPNLIKLILENNETQILRRPLGVFRILLTKVAERAIELNDKELNGLMIRLTLYECADPTSKEYNRKLIAEYLGETG